MKKLFTLIAVALMAVTANATKLQLNVAGLTPDQPAQNVWGGKWLDADPATEDWTDYDYFVIEFEKCPSIKVGVAYQKVIGQESWGDVHLTTEGTFNAGTVVAGVKIDPDYADQPYQYFWQTTAAGDVVVKDAYLCDEETYQSVLAGNKPQSSELSLADLGSGWGNSTYDAATKTITIGDDWSGKGWWLDKADYTDFEQLLVRFDPATASNGKVVVEYNASGVASSESLFEAGTTSVVVDFDATGKSSVKQIYIQGPAGSTYTLASVVVATKEYVAAGVKTIHAIEKKADGRMYNLAGQQVSETYKGVVIRDGKKFFNR